MTRDCFPTDLATLVTRLDAADAHPNALRPRYGEAISPDMLTIGAGATPSVHVPW